MQSTTIRILATDRIRWLGNHKEGRIFLLFGSPERMIEISFPPNNIWIERKSQYAFSLIIRRQAVPLNVKLQMVTGEINIAEEKNRVIIPIIGFKKPENSKKKKIFVSYDNSVVEVKSRDRNAFCLEIHKREEKKSLSEKEPIQKEHGPLIEQKISPEVAEGTEVVDSLEEKILKKETVESDITVSKETRNPVERLIKFFNRKENS